jgi:DNA (cytosine-5)-methyltransferase 1
MAEISALPWNGYNVVSTFSGCGGSCLGYRMAGYRVLWASEFIEEAQKTYKANHPDSILDTRDIRQVKPEEILQAIGMKPGDLDLFDGSPPCASFSTAGKREAGWGKVKAYSDKAQRTDDLFFEYVRILRGLQPKVFVAENVSGLVKGTAKGYFLEILSELKASGYDVSARVLDAQWLGVPQSRERLIFVGVRNELGLKPAHPKPLQYRYSVRDAIRDGIDGMHMKLGGDLAAFYSKQRRGESRYEAGVRLSDRKGGMQKVRLNWTSVAPTVTQSGHDLWHPEEARTLSIPELRRIGGFPDDFILTGTFAQQWERIGRAVPPVMMSHIAETIKMEILCKTK